MWGTLYSLCWRWRECKSATAKDGKEGLVKLKDSKIDMVFTDINMPNINGLSMIKTIRTKDRLIPIVSFQLTKIRIIF